MSSVKGYVRLTSVNPGLLLQLSKCTLAGTVLPAFENVMNVRHQYIENCLLDAIRPSSRA